MSAAATFNPTPLGESQSARRKKNKAGSGTPTSDAAVDKKGSTGTDAGGNGADGGSELPFLKELHKNVRNVKKKIAATQKVDSIVAEYPGLSLDDLLATKKINTDQKLQAERKPALQVNLKELEEEVDRYKKVEDLAAEKHEAEKEALKTEHAKEISALKESVAQEATATGSQQLRENLLHLSQFLRAAAAKRQDGDETAEESRAFEGALLLVYGGDASAVQAMEHIIEGSDELVPSVEGTKTIVSYKQLRATFSNENETADEEARADTPTHADHASTTDGTDPTVAHAGLTEIDDPTTMQSVNGSGTVASPTAPETGVVDSGAANAAAESGWNNMTSSVTSGPEDWVQVHQIPRDPAETETGTGGTAAAATSTQSWAEDVPTEPVQPTAIPAHPAPPANDGFHEVHHGRSRGRGGFQGEHRGRGRGGFRGDRGDGSFRGRGGFRGDRGEGGPRGRGRGGFRGPRGGRGESAPPS